MKLTGNLWLDSNSNEGLEVAGQAAAVNHVRVRNAATGADPDLAAVGDDANIDLNLLGKGTGRVQEGGVNLCRENRLVSSGTGLTGGGSLAADRTLALTAGALSALGTSPVFSQTAEAANAITVEVQLRSFDGANLGSRTPVRVWIGDGAFGAETAAAPSGGVTVGTGTVLETVTANKHWIIIPGASGNISLTLTEAAAKTFHLMATMGDHSNSTPVVFV